MKVIFKKFSIRARVAYGALCLENLLKDTFVSSSEYRSILDLIWLYTAVNPGTWHYKMSEATPFSIEDPLPYKEKGYEFLSKDQHDQLAHLYSQMGSEAKQIINLLFEIGTLDLYSTIKNGSPRTLQMLLDIADTVAELGVDLPPYEPLLKYGIQEEQGWGKTFEREDLRNI